MLNSLTVEMADFRGKVPIAHLKFLRRLFGGRPIPLWYWSLWRHLMAICDSGPDPLFPPAESLCSRGESIQIEELRTLLREDVLGEWSLDAETIMLLWEILQREKPRLIVECGAGISTLMLAQYAAAFSETDPCFIISLEQDLQTLRTVDARLRSVNFDDFVCVVHSPVDANGNYCLNDFEKTLAGKSRRDVDFLLIDGPAGETGCRLATLPMLLGYCSQGARWCLDDAFRDGEMEILSQWSRLAGVEVEGIYPIGKGLGTGSVERREPT